MKKKYLFIHIPKCAGISLVSNLERHLNFTRIGPHEKAKFLFSKQHKYKLNREEYYTFSFVRNPWDRLVSTFFYILKGGRSPIDAKRRDLFLKKYNGNFDKFIYDIENWFHITEEESIYEDLYIPHFRPQAEFIFDDKNRLLVDFLGKIESIDACHRALCQQLNIPHKRLKKKNSSTHDNYQSYYNEETVKIVEEYYSCDVKLLNYSFAESPPDLGMICRLKKPFRKFLYN